MGISVIPAPSVGGGKIMKRETLLSGTSYTVPAGVTDMNVILVGGGGGSGTTDGNNQAHDRPMGGPGQIRHSTLSVTPGQTISYSIGGGGSGAGGNSTAGGAGGTTTMTGAVSASGGLGGLGPQDQSGVRAGQAGLVNMNGAGWSTSNDSNTTASAAGGQGCIIVEYWV